MVFHLGFTPMGAISISYKQYKLDEVGPVDNRPSTTEGPPRGKFHPFSKITVTLEPVMQLRCPFNI